MDTELYQFGDKVKMINFNHTCVGRIGTFISSTYGRPKVHLYPKHHTENSMLWEHVYLFDWEDFSKLTGQLLFDFMY